MIVPAPGEVVAALGLPALVDARRMAGFDAVVWRCTLSDGRTLAVRLLQPGRSGDPDVAALRLAAEHRRPAPRVVATGAVAGVAAIAMTWLPGRTMADLLLGGDRRRLGVAFGRAQADLHRPIGDAIEGLTLCHLDYHPFNVLVEDDAAEPEGARVSGIVDWTNARIDDRRADLATTRVVLDLAPVIDERLVPVVDAFRDHWREGYAALRTMPDDDELAPFLAAAAERQAADWSRRSADGPVPARVAERADRLARRWAR